MHLRLLIFQHGRYYAVLRSMWSDDSSRRRFEYTKRASGLDQAVGFQEVKQNPRGAVYAAGADQLRENTYTVVILLQDK